MSRSLIGALAFVAIAGAAVLLAVAGRTLHPLEELSAEADRLVHESDPVEFQSRRREAIRRLELHEPLRRPAAAALRARLELLGLDPEAALRYSPPPAERAWAALLLWAAGAGAMPSETDVPWARAAVEAASGTRAADPHDPDPRVRFVLAATALRNGDPSKASEIAAVLIGQTPGFLPARWIAAAAGSESIGTLEKWAPDSPLVARLAANLREAEDLGWKVEELEGDPAAVARAIQEHLSGGGARAAKLIARLAAAYERLGDLDRAYDLFRELVDRHPRDLPAVRALGRIDYARGRYKHASVALGAAIAFDPEDGESCLLLARTLVRDSPPQAERAARFFDEAIRRGRDGGEVRLELGRVLFSLGEWKRAEDCFRRAIELEETPDALTALANALIRNGSYAEARRLLSRALKLEPSLPEAAFLRSMIDYFTGDDPAAAAREIGRAVEAGFRTKASLILRARCRSDAEDLEGALSDLREALLEDPDSGDALALRAEIHLKSRRPEEALRDAELALRSGAESVDLHLVRAGAAMLLSDSSRALESLDRASVLAPDRHDLHAKRFLILVESGNLEASLEAIGRALGLAPRNISYRLHRGWVRFQLGSFRDALTDFEEIRRNQPDNASAIEWSGRARLEIGEVEQGLTEIARVLQTQGPSRTDLWLVVARAELDRSRWEAALDAAEKAERGVEEELEGLIIAGRALAALARPEAAMAKFDQALSVDEGSAEAWFRRGEAKETLGLPGGKEDLDRAVLLRPDWKGRAAAVLERAPPPHR
jgi:tetratricopeptide (TPR) repeat protein